MMLMSAGSHHPTISTLRAAAGSTTTATEGDAAAGSASTEARAAMERSGSGQDGQSLRCPRCDSSNTKFCYYNNYSLSQPRHFCKACKRYWTRGGTLRNVPVGGGCRKNKRTRKHINSSSRATSSSSTDIAPMPPLSSSHPSPTPIATAAAAASSSNLGSLLYGHASDVSQLAFPNPCVPYDLGSLGVFPSNADEDCLPEVNTQFAAHPILQQTAPPSSATASFASLLQDYSLFGSNPMAAPHASTFKQQRQQQQGMTQNPNLSQYITLLSHATCENPVLQNDVKAEGNRDESTTGLTNQHRFSWQIPSRENSLLESVANEPSLYWNAAAASAFGGGALL